MANEHNRMRLWGVVNTPVRGMLGVMGTQITPDACRAARALLKWSTRDLARHAGLALTTVNQFETGTRQLRQESADKLLATFTANGVEILNGGSPGARLKPKPLNSED